MDQAMTPQNYSRCETVKKISGCMLTFAMVMLRLQEQLVEVQESRICPVIGSQASNDLKNGLATWLTLP
jgi:hypothetical protein